MRFAPGSPRHPNAGRKKGTGNKQKIKKACEFFAEIEVCPAEEIYKLIVDGDLTDFAKAQLWVQLMPYTQTKPKEEVEDGDKEPGQELLEHFREVSDAALLQLVPKKENV